MKIYTKYHSVYPKLYVIAFLPKPKLWRVSPNRMSWFWAWYNTFVDMNSDMSWLVLKACKFNVLLTHALVALFMIRFWMQNFFLLCGFLERSTHLLFQFFQSSRLRSSHMLWPESCLTAPEIMWMHLTPDCLLCATVNQVWLLKVSSYFLLFGNRSGSFTVVLLTNLELYFFVYNPLLIHTVQQLLTVTIRHHPRHPWVMFTEI